MRFLLLTYGSDEDFERGVLETLATRPAIADLPGPREQARGAVSVAWTTTTAATSRWRRCSRWRRTSIPRRGARERRSGAFYTLVPIRPRSRGERRSLRTLPGASLRPPLAFNPRPRRLSTPPDAFELHPAHLSWADADGDRSISLTEFHRRDDVSDVVPRRGGLRRVRGGADGVLEVYVSVRRGRTWGKRACLALLRRCSPSTRRSRTSCCAGAACTNDGIGKVCESLLGHPTLTLPGHRG